MHFSKKPKKELPMPKPPDIDETQVLKSEIRLLRGRLAALEARIGELEGLRVVVLEVGGTLRRVIELDPPK